MVMVLLFSEQRTPLGDNMAQYINLTVYALVMIFAICVTVENQQKIYEMISWFFVGLLNTAFYMGILFFDMPHGHNLSVIRSQITAVVILAYILGYHIIGEKYV